MRLRRVDLNCHFNSMGFYRKPLVQMPRRIPKGTLHAIKVIWHNRFVIWHVAMTLLITAALYSVWDLAKQKDRDSRAARTVLCQQLNKRNDFDRNRIKLEIERTTVDIKESIRFIHKNPNGIPGISVKLIKGGIHRSFKKRNDNKKDLRVLKIIPCMEFSRHPERF